MKIENLQIGQVLKSYKQLCEVLEESVTAGNSKKSQIKEWERYFNYHKEGNKFIIDEIYDAPLKKTDKRMYGNNKGNTKQYKEFNVDEDEENNIGIYYIILNDDIYIGSTYAGFKKRFLQHYYGESPSMKHTYKLLQNGGVFNILYNMSGIDDIQLIRMVEHYFIDYFDSNVEFNVINKIKSSCYKNIEVKLTDYYDIIKLLSEHGFIINRNPIYVNNNTIIIE